MRKPLLLVGVALLAAAASLAQIPSLSDELQVNTYTTDFQRNPSIAMLGPSGDFLVVWGSDTQDGSSFGVYAQRFDRFAAPVGSEFRINSYTTQYQAVPSAAADGDGNFVVVWTDRRSGTFPDVFARRFDTSGNALGEDFQINTYSTASQFDPEVAMAPDGTFVVVWTSDGQDGNSRGVFGRRFEGDGDPLGSEFQVNTYTTGYQGQAQVAADSAGGFFVVWNSAGPDGDGFGIRGRRYNDAGTALGAEFGINVFTAGEQSFPEIARDASGRSVVVWHSVLQDGSGTGVIGRRFDASGDALGPEFLVNTYTTSSQFRPVVAAAPTGDFLVVWQGLGRDDPSQLTEPGVFAQRFDAVGRRVGAEFPINTHTTDVQTLSTVAADPGGGFVAAWDSFEQDGSQYATIARRLNTPSARPMRVDEPAPGISAHAPAAVAGNRVLEPGETVAVEPAWANTLPGTITVTGAASEFQGPAGGAYNASDAAADYGSIPGEATADCRTATGNCYRMTVAGSPRPATHWDATFRETLSVGISKTWSLHVGESFTDVPTSQLFYRAIESVLHAGITTGCTAAAYCPGDPVTRSQMSLFLARGVAGSGPAIPARGLLAGNAYNCDAGGTSLLADVEPTDIFCRSVHYLAAQNVTSGCSATQYCPTPNVTRLEMSAFVARAVVAPGGGAAVPLTYTDPVTNLSYSCDAGSPNLHFTDVPASNSFCKHAHFLWAKGIISGCGATTYCPDDAVTRDAMARFLANGFGVQLYGP